MYSIVYGYLLTDDALFEVIYDFLTTDEKEKVERKKKGIEKRARRMCENEEKDGKKYMDQYMKLPLHVRIDMTEEKWNDFTDQYMKRPLQERIDLTAEEMWNEYQICDFMEKYSGRVKDHGFVIREYRGKRVIGIEVVEGEEGIDMEELKGLEIEELRKRVSGKARLFIVCEEN